MSNTTTDIEADVICAVLDQMAHALAAVPGQHPGDVQRARTLLSLTSTLISGSPPSGYLLDTLRAYGADAGEVQAVARALAGLGLRLGAWLGRSRS